MPPPLPDGDPQRLRSAAWLGFFLRILRQRLAASFHAVRVARPGVPAVSPQLPLIVYCNHPSWWDAALLPVLVAHTFPSRRAFGPIDAAALQRYRFMRRLGFFGIVPGSYAGASTFLRIGRQILSQPDTVFCITPQGDFVDVRRRPVRLQPGLVGLLSITPRVTVLPIAVDYPFWSERTPEALVRFGVPRVMGSESGLSLDAVADDLSHRLTDAMDRLADDAISRDAGRFDTLVHGKAGVGGVYDAWRRVRAWSQGERFVAAHAPDKGLIPVIVLAWVSAALALLPLGMAVANVRWFTRPTRLPPVGTGVSILIPARDEAAGIAQAVHGALASRGVEVEVLVLDDNSSDDTAARVAAIAAQDARVQLHAAPPLPPGWAGKQRACHLLAARARHPVLMFVDADVRLSPDAAAFAAGRLLADDRLGMVSGFPRERTVGVAEQLVIPWIHILLLGYLPMWRMRASASPAYGAACGQWIVARRTAYAQVGGHAASRASRHDGLSLPRTFRAAGWRTDLFDGSALAECRMYRDLGSVWRGFAKSAGEGMATTVALPIWTLLLALGHVLPAPLAVAGLVTGRSEVAMVACGGVVANALLRWLLCRRLQQSALGAWLHPVGAAFVLANQWTALVGHWLGRPSTWRGRRYLPHADA